MIIASDDSGFVQIVENLGDGGLVLAAAEVTGQRRKGLGFRDINGDGTADAVTANGGIAATS